MIPGVIRVDEQLRQRLVQRLLDWFTRHRRDLPWRAAGPRDPYRVWISEAMLQQTRVATVIDYFQRFIRRFPDVASLAEAEQAEVLQLWSGLGYYRRARMLHAGARAVQQLHAGRMPSTRAELEALPGIGPYTAGAIASLAFDAPEALVDGNVERVFARLFGIEAAQASTALKRQAWEVARALCPQRGAGAWNEALMELGALVCTPREPKCALCPLAGECAASRAGRAAELPLPRVRAAPLTVELEVLLLRSSGGLLFQQRPAGGRMAGLWELPVRERVSPGAATRLHPAEWDPRLEQQRLIVREEESRLRPIRHSITCHRIRAEIVHGTIAAAPSGPVWAWRDREAALELGLTGLTRKVLRSLAKE